MLTPKKSVERNFHNVDFDIWSRSDLTPLVKALEDKVIVLHNERTRGRHWVSFEFGTPRSADAAIRRFSELILGLHRSVRKVWNEATARDFDIGLGAHDERQYVVLSKEAVELTARLSARIVFTMYPEKDDD